MVRDPILDKKEQNELDDQEYSRNFFKAIREDRTDDQEAEKKPDVTYLYDDYVTPLGTKLRDDFESAERDRSDIEDRWLNDLRQYKAQYSPEELARMHPKRSKAYMSITRTKVKTVSARQLDILFPANEGKNWGINPTPVPDLAPEAHEQMIAEITQIMGQVPSDDQLKKILFDEAKSRCEKMEREMDDQLAEIKYRDIIRKVIQSGNLYGTGVLKGPLIKEKIVKRWVKGPEWWQTIELKSLSPYCEFVPIWDIYPDMTATEPDNLRRIFQRNVMPRHKVYALSKRKDFNGKAIKAYLKAYPDGDADYKNFENSLKNMGSNSTVDFAKIPGRDGKYEVIEFWGFVNTDDLKDVDIDIPEDKMGLEVACNIWLLGSVVIKAVISPIEGVNFPYFFYYFDKDETSIFGEGIPVAMRDSQTLFNASIRAMLDNAAIAAGPIIEANVDLLDAADDPTDLYPFRVYQRTGTGSEATAKAIHVTSMPSYTNEFLELANFFMSLADEITVIPRYMHGDNNNVRGAGQTATGLSMLMGAVNITLKDLVKSFDDGITKPFIKSLYFWNMEFNKKPDIKGDYSVIAKGSSSLIAKEVRSEQLLGFLNITNNPVDLQYIHRDVALREILKTYDLSDIELIKSPFQIQEEQKAQQAEAQRQQAYVENLELLKAKSSGHVDNQGNAEGSRPIMEQLSPEQLQQGQIPQVQGVM